MTRFHLLAATAACLVAGAVGPQGANAQTVVTPTNTQGWTAANIRGGGTAAITDSFKPAGQNGSLEFRSTGASDKADFTNYWGVQAGRTLGTIGTLGYDWYRDAAGVTAGNQHLMPAFRLAYLTADNRFGYLIYEDVYNGGSTSRAVPTGSWQVTDLSSANFWQRDVTGGATIEAYDFTLAEWRDGAVFDTATRRSTRLGADTSIVGIEVGVGSGFGGTFRGAVDNISVSFGAGNSVTANFEPAAVAAVPEPASWAMMIGGFGLVGAAARTRRRAVRFAA